MGEKKEKIIKTIKIGGSLITAEKVYEVIKNPDDYNKGIDAMVDTLGIAGVSVNDKAIKDAIKTEIKWKNTTLNDIEKNAVSPKYDNEITENNSQTQNSSQSQNSQTPTFSPKNLTESEITQINEALGRYGVADKERYLREIDDKMAVFNGYLDNRCDALEKFTKNSDLSEASNDFDEAVKQQENLLKEELSFTEKLLLKDFAHKLYGVKMPETKQRIGIDAATQCKISLF